MTSAHFGDLDHFRPKSPKWVEVTVMWAEVTWSEIVVGRDSQYPQAVTHPIMNRARRSLTLVIEPIPMS